MNDRAGVCSVHPLEGDGNAGIRQGALQRLVPLTDGGDNLLSVFAVGCRGGDAGEDLGVLRFHREAGGPTGFAVDAECLSENTKHIGLLLIIKGSGIC
jgi:hypothetical protein